VTKSLSSPGCSRQGFPVTSRTSVVREVPAVATLTVDHRIYCGRVCGDGFAIVSPDGVITVVDGRLRPVRQADVGGAVADLSANGDSWAWVTGERLWVDAFPGTGGVSAPLPGEASCRWLPSGRALWAANGTGDEVRVALHTPDNQVMRTVTVPDAFGESMVKLRRHPHDGAVVLWIAAGQDGQQSWLVRDDGTALFAEHLPADDCLPAHFGPDADWLLAADDYGLTMLSWPDRTELGALSWADIDPEAEADGSDTPGGCLMALPGGFVSWNTGNGRLRTIDLTTMSVVDEIALAGHPVRTVADRHPTLATDHNPCGDFAYAVPHDDGMVLSVHGENTVVLSALRDWSPDPDRGGRQ
jgi:hypothetical protein